jgi:hypothetical protein
MAATRDRPVAATVCSVRQRRKGSGLPLGPKAEWDGYFQGNKKGKWVELLWLLGRIPKRNMKIVFILILAAKMGEFKCKFEF